MNTKPLQCIILTVSNKAENASVERTCSVFGRDEEGENVSRWW